MPSFSTLMFQVERLQGQLKNTCSKEVSSYSNLCLLTKEEF